MKQLLSLFNLRSIEIALYEKLFYGDLMGASKLAKEINISRTSVYDLLDRLIALGLVVETQKSGIKMFTATSPDKLEIIVKEKQRLLNLASQELNSLKDIYSKKKKSVKPRLEMYEGRVELQQMMKDVLLYRDMTVLAYWPVLKIIKLLSPEFLQQFHKERVARNIKLKVIWPHSHKAAIKKYYWLKTGLELKREIKIAPQNVEFSLGYVIYGNTVRFLSSSKENFGFLIASQELAQTMKSQFELIWKQSNSYK